MDVVGVVFSSGGKVYSFDAGGLDLAWDERVICQTSRGQELGRVVQANHAPDGEPRSLKKVVRRATDLDKETVDENRREAAFAMTAFKELISKDRLEIKPISCEVVFDGSRVVLSYEGKKPEVNALQRALTQKLHRKIELRSVGPRESARLCGDVGLCGTRHCCRRFPSHEKPITLRMAKDQELPLSSGRITGLCGRLRCCLAFEHPLYRSFRDRAPRVGGSVETPGGRGIVTGYAVLEDSCSVQLADEEEALSFKIDDCQESR